MSYALGGKVQSTDLNSFTTTFNALWSTGSSNSGYGQTAIPSVSYGEKVRANSYWRALVQNIEASANHQGSSISAMTPTPTTAGKIQFLANVSSNLTTINNNRLNAVSSGSTSSTTLTSVEIWNNSLVMTFDVTFASNNHARYFFNAGGQIGLSFSHPNTGNINTLISDICAEAGTVWISSPTSGTATISGTAYSGVTKVGGVSSVRQTVNTNYGFYAFNSTSTEIFKQTGDAGTYSAYLNSFLQIKASTNSAGVITFVCVIDEVPDGLDVATGTVGTLTIRPPSTTYLSNSWGTPSVSGTITYNTALFSNILIVSGGGAGGGAPPDSVGGGGSGGGGGGFYAFNLLLSGSSYNIVIGAGGTGGSPYSPPNGTQGTGSSITNNDNSLSYNSGGGFGGGGGYTPNGGYYAGGAGGTPNGSVGGAWYSGITAGSNGVGAGGGASGNDDQPQGGAGYYAVFKGGDGPIWTPNGTRYAGGGGGTTDHNNRGYGGAGGGGDGGADGQSGFAGTVNTGGGGGGAGQGGNGGSGGSGVVIIRYPGSPQATGGTITTSGGYTYHTFTSSGTLTT
jgi:hypothetical protein